MTTHDGDAVGRVAGRPLSSVVMRGSTLSAPVSVEARWSGSALGPSWERAMATAIPSWGQVGSREKPWMFSVGLSAKPVGVLRSSTRGSRYPGRRWRPPPASMIVMWNQALKVELDPCSKRRVGDLLAFGRGNAPAAHPGRSRQLTTPFLADGNYGKCTKYSA